MKVGDLVKIKDKFVGASEEQDLLMLITEVEKGFYLNRTGRITMLASNGEILHEPEQCLEIINEA